MKDKYVYRKCEPIYIIMPAIYIIHNIFNSVTSVIYRCESSKFKCRNCFQLIGWCIEILDTSAFCQHWYI